MIEEGDLKTRTGLLREARKILERGNYPVEEGGRLLDLLTLIVNTMDDTVLGDEKLAAGLVAAVADNGKLLLLIERQAAELDALKRITLNLTSSLDLQAVLDGVVQEAMSLVKDAEDAHIFLLHGEKLVFGASLRKDGEKNQLTAVPNPEGLTYQVAREKKVVTVTEATAHPLYPDAAEQWSGSIISIPLMMGTRVIGVMNLARSTTGDFDPSELRLLMLLADQATIAIINARLHTAVSQQARSDMLTNLPNRRALDERLEVEIEAARGSLRPLSLIMMDLDGFKVVNDTHGHDIGDEVLRRIAAQLAQTLRSTDFLARYGGDEMTLILPDTDLPQAVIVARKLQKQLLSIPSLLPDGNTLTLGMTGGIALFPRHADSPPGLLRAADEALYRAKKYARGTFMAAREPTKDLEINKEKKS